MRLGKCRDCRKRKATMQVEDVPRCLECQVAKEAPPEPEKEKR